MAFPPMPLLTEKLKARFWAKVCKTDGCWLWTAHKDPRGYGRLSCQMDGKTVPILAPRLSLLMAGHTPLNDQFALHSCDNPSCVNPAHLRWGTALENSRDMVARGRTTPTEQHSARMRACARRGSSHHFFKVPDEIVVLIFGDARSHREIAAAYGVSQGYVSLVKSGKTRSEVTRWIT